MILICQMFDESTLIFEWPWSLFFPIGHTLVTTIKPLWISLVTKILFAWHFGHDWYFMYIVYLIIVMQQKIKFFERSMWSQEQFLVSPAQPQPALQGQSNMSSRSIILSTVDSICNLFFSNYHLYLLDHLPLIYLTHDTLHMTFISVWISETIQLDHFICLTDLDD